MLLTRAAIETWEKNNLSPLAAKTYASKGRQHPEKEHPYRTAYQRDRDRIIHSAAFRRLEYKTQVFVCHEGDYYRTRLTHTLEVTQIARTISKALRLNEDLTEAISLAHDLGHTPFGHAVENTLNELMINDGGFNHNVQGLRVVDFLEERYPNFKGLNLSWETREAIIKHDSTHKKYCIGEYSCFAQAQPTLEAQVMDVADEIAYDNHDIDDGLKSGMITQAQLYKIELWKRTERQLKKQYSKLTLQSRLHLIIRNLINVQVTDLITATGAAIRKTGIGTITEVRGCPKRLVAFSPELAGQREELRVFLSKYLYNHWRVIRMSDKAGRFIASIFETYLKNPNLLPPNFKKPRYGESFKRAICDYLSGMTDRYALDEYKKLFDPYEKV